MTNTPGPRAMFIDAHAHMDAYDEKTMSLALAEVSEHRILTVSTSMDIPSYERASQIAEACDWILPIFGIHPWFAKDYACRLEELNPYIEQSPMIGEIGLDYYYVSDRESYPAQRKVFKHFLAAAREQDKIVNIHSKGAEKDILELLRQFGIKRTIVHWYSGSFDVFDDLVGLDAYFTVGVEMAHSSHIKAIAKDIPMDRLLTETDNPGGMTYQNGNVGLPHHIMDVVQALAGLRDVSVEAMAQTVRSNFAELVREDPWLAGLNVDALYAHPQA